MIWPYPSLLKAAAGQGYLASHHGAVVLDTDAGL